MWSSNLIWRFQSCFELQVILLVSWGGCASWFLCSGLGQTRSQKLVPNDLHWFPPLISASIFFVCLYLGTVRFFLVSFAPHIGHFVALISAHLKTSVGLVCSLYLACLLIGCEFETHEKLQDNFELQNMRITNEDNKCDNGNHELPYIRTGHDITDWQLQSLSGYVVLPELHNTDGAFIWTLIKQGNFFITTKWTLANVCQHS